MSFSRDGQIHYYAHKGVADLTKDDFLMSSFPYGEKCVTFDNFFFNVANWDDGHTWSTPWVIDDPKIYAIPPEGQSIAQSVPREKAAAAQMQKATAASVEEQGPAAAGDCGALRIGFARSRCHAKMRRWPRTAGNFGSTSAVRSPIVWPTSPDGEVRRHKLLSSA